jgi:hypothetical protein
MDSVSGAAKAKVAMTRDATTEPMRLEMARMAIHNSSSVNSARNKWRNIIANWTNPFGVGH